MSAPDSQLSAALRLTERMLELARDADWEELARVERERAGVLESCFGHENHFRDKDLATRTIRKLLDLDRAIIALGEPRRRQLATELDQLQQGCHARRVYANARHLMA